MYRVGWIALFCLGLLLIGCAPSTDEFLPPAPAAATTSSTPIIENKDPIYTSFGNQGGEGTESEMLVVMEIRLSKPSERSLLVSFETTGGTAIPGVDYVGGTDTVEFIPGQTSFEVAINIRDNGTANINKTIEISLINSNEAIISNPSVFRYTILDDD